MSVINLSKAKAFLDVFHDSDDEKLQDLLDGAEEEALHFMKRSHFSGACPAIEGDPLIGVSDPDEVTPGQRVAVFLLLQASYGASPDDAEKLRRAAQIKLRPYRCSAGL